MLQKTTRQKYPDVPFKFFCFLPVCVDLCRNRKSAQSFALQSGCRLSAVTNSAAISAAWFTIEYCLHKAKPLSSDLTLHQWYWHTRGHEHHSLISFLFPLSRQTWRQSLRKSFSVWFSQCQSCEAFKCPTNHHDINKRSWSVISIYGTFLTMNQKGIWLFPFSVGDSSLPLYHPVLTLISQVCLSISE